MWLTEVDAKTFFEKIFPTLFNPKAAKGWNRTIQFDITDAGTWCVEVRDQQVTVREGPCPKAQMGVKASFETILGIYTGKLFAPTALSKKLLQVTGPLTDHMKMSKVFHKWEPGKS